MNSKLKFVSICSVLSLIPMIGYAANLACPTAQEVMKAADPVTGQVNLQTAFGTLTGVINPSVDSYVFTNVAIPIEKVGGQSVTCSYLSTQVYPLPSPLRASTSSIFTPVVGTWETGGSYSLCSQNNPSQCQFVQKVANTH